MDRRKIYKQTSFEMDWQPTFVYSQLVFEHFTWGSINNHKSQHQGNKHVQYVLMLSIGTDTKNNKLADFLMLG